MRILVEDASPGTGGALTSLAALVPLLEARGHSVRVHALAVRAAQDAGLEDARPLGAALIDATWPRRHASRALYTYRRLAHERPDVLVGNNSPRVNASLAAAARVAGVPFVQYVRAAVADDPVTGAVLASAAAVVAVGPDVARSARLAGARSVLVAGEGLDTRRWPSARAADAERWLWCGAHASHKGLSLFVEAYRDVAGAPAADVCAAPIPDAPGQPRVALPAMPEGASLYLEPSGPVLDALRARSYAYFHTALVPEPYGRTILEAAAAGLCPVVPDEGSGPRLVTHGVDGVLYEARSARSLSAAMRDLAARPGWARELGERARTRAAWCTAERALRPVAEAIEGAAHRAPRAMAW